MTTRAVQYYQFIDHVIMDRRAGRDLLAAASETGPGGGGVLLGGGSQTATYHCVRLSPDRTLRVSFFCQRVIFKIQREDRESAVEARLVVLEGKLVDHPLTLNHFVGVHWPSDRFGGEQCSKRLAAQARDMQLKTPYSDGVD